MARRKKKRSVRRSTRRRRRTCKKVCTICGNAYPKGKMSPKKYIAHVNRWHTSKVLC